jgi:hypothetical protein
MNVIVRVVRFVRWLSACRGVRFTSNDSNVRGFQWLRLMIVSQTVSTSVAEW